MTSFLILLLAAGAGASQPDADAVETSARHLEARLIAPCCWRQPLSMHDSEPARVMKEEIRRDLASGKTEEEILAAYEARYGLRILAEPPAVGFHRVLYVLPVLVLAGSAISLSFVLSRWRRKKKEAGSDRPRPSSERLAQIERELETTRTPPPRST